jgi:subtilisin family serine protease
MPSLLLAGVVLVLVAGAGVGSGSSGGAPTLARAGASSDYVPGELIVRFRSGATASERSAALSAQGARPSGGLGFRMTRVKLPAGTSVEQAAEELEADPDVLYAEPNYLRTLSVLPNDPMFGQLYALSQPSDRDIDAPSAWNQTTGSSNVIVAVIDSGVAYGHPDLNGNIWVNNDPPGNGDDDGNGFVDDTFGWDFVQNDNAPLDFNGHGTHVAGTIGAEGNNGVGVTGVNWDLSLMPLRAADAGGSLEDADIIAAIQYACDNGADVVNGSFGSPSPSMAIASAVTDASCANTLFVFAAGNEGTNLEANGAANDSFPCELHRAPAQGGVSAPNVLCIAATGSTDSIAGFSNRGVTAVHLAAPGVNIRSTWPAYSTLPGFPEGYEGSSSSFNSRWGDRTGGPPSWNRTTLRKKGGSFSLADSPTTNYPNDASRTIRRLAPLNLAGRAGCFVENWLRLDAEFQFDFFDVLAGTTTGTTTLIGSWTGNTGGSFIRVTDDLSAFDGQATVYLRFGFFSDNAVFFDGAYVDNTTVKCLNQGGGTSMSTPHVSGVAALLLADDPTMTVADLKAAILGGVDVVGGLSTHVATSGRLNADRALGLTPDDTGPNTTIASGPSGRTGKHKAKFAFTGSEPGVKFQCKHMNGPWTPCNSPKTYTGLGNGKHTFQVRAMDTNGNVDPTPATRNWRIV